jgi:hypothetical protein
MPKSPPRAAIRDRMDEPRKPRDSESPTPPLLRVECYSGHKADQRPTRVFLHDQALKVSEVEDRWYSPGFTFFRVLLANGERYVLGHQEAQDRWTIEAFRRSSGSPEVPLR